MIKTNKGMVYLLGQPVSQKMLWVFLVQSLGYDKVYAQEAVYRLFIKARTK